METSRHILLQTLNEVWVDKVELNTDSAMLIHLHTGWCNTLVAGPSLGAKGFMFFDIGVTLTEEGEG